MTSLNELLAKRAAEYSSLKDFHIVRFFSSFIVVSKGKVISVSDPQMRTCPLAGMFYKKIRRMRYGDGEKIKTSLKEMIEAKINRFGSFTPRRDFSKVDISVPYGASEILMYALKKKMIDAAVVACDGAGSVVVTDAELVQGIGARMNGLFYTSPILEVVERLMNLGAAVVYPDARIDQTGAVEYACRSGCKKIAVTVNASMAEESFAKIRGVAKQYGVDIAVLVVCTTGINGDRCREIKESADVVWSCASQEVREIIGPEAILQLSEAIPVFVLTKKGLDFVSAYSDEPDLLQALDLRGQYLISSSQQGQRIRMGHRTEGLCERRLPVRSVREPQ